VAAASRKRLAWFLAALFALSMFMGTGPGVMLVNRPTMAFGLPLVYVWAIVWYFVQVAVVVSAYIFVWRDTD
jgi:hypothetical protein